MSQPNPSATADGEEQRLPTNAEDRKAAAALSSLNDNEIGDTSNNNSTNKLSSADAQEALGKAMSRLEIAAGGGGGGKPGAANNKVAGEKAGAAQVEKKKAVKVAAEDVTLLVEQLDLTKNKATELLKSHDGDARVAIRAFITPSVVA